MSENQEKVQIQIPKQTQLDLENPLDKLVYTLTEKRKELEEKTEELKKKVTEFVNDRIEILKAYGYGIESVEVKNIGLLDVIANIVINAKIHPDDVFDSDEIRGNFGEYGARLVTRKLKSVYDGENSYVVLEVKFEVYDRSYDRLI